MIDWERTVIELVDEARLSRLRVLVERTREAQGQKEKLLLRVATLLFGVAALFVWLAATPALEERADLGNGLIALVLAIWAWHQPRLPKLDRNEVDAIVGDRVPAAVFAAMQQDSKPRTDAGRLLPLLAAVALFVVILIKSTSSI